MDVARLAPGDRRALVAVAAQFSINGVLSASVIARAPVLRDRIDVSLDAYGLLLAAAGVAGLVGSLLAGRIIERFTSRRVLIVAGLAMGSAVVVVGLARSPALFLVGLTVMFLADVLVDIAMNLQASWLSARREVPVMQRLHGLWSVGSLTGGLIAVAAGGLGIGVVAHLSVVAAVGIVGTVTIATGVLAVDETGHADAITSPGAVPVSARRAMALIVLAGVFAILLEQTGSDWAAFRLTDDFGASAAVGSLAFAAFTFGMASARFGGDLLEARIGRDGLHRWTLSLAVVGFVVASFAPTEWLAIVAYVAVGAGVAPLFPRLYDDAARLPGRRGAGLGAMTAGTRIAGFSAPALVGAIAATSWSVGDAVAVVTLPSAAAYAVVIAATRRASPR